MNDATNEDVCREFEAAVNRLKDRYNGIGLNFVLAYTINDPLSRRSYYNYITSGPSIQARGLAECLLDDVRDDMWEQGAGKEADSGQEAD